MELENIRNAHIKDGVAFTKFMYWLKTNVGKIPMTEISAADYLLACRAEQEGFIEPSFDTISAYKANAAMMHYSATKESDAVLQAEGMLLVDSGGQYYEGTTDITRTMVLGPITNEQKLHFTTVLRSNLNLANARFLHGCVGMNLDILARGPIGIRFLLQMRHRSWHRLSAQCSRSAQWLPLENRGGTPGQRRIGRRHGHDR